MTAFVRRLAAFVAGSAMVALLVAPSALAAAPSWSHRDAHICGPGAADQAGCTSIARVLYANGLEYRAATPAQLKKAAQAAASVSYTAVGIRAAYGILGQGDPSRVIAIVDGYDDPGAYSHLATYRSGMGLPAIQSCTLSQLIGLTSTSATPCFAKVNQNGGTALPTPDSGWSNEMDLDLQAASAICPRCSLLLLEASTPSFANLGAAVTTASNTPHVVAISNSYGTTNDVPGSAYPAWDRAAQKGIAVMAAAGDWGYATSFPASSTDVIGVGGTTLTVGTSGARNGETAWSSTGSGCSVYNAAPSWQVIPNSPCGSMKAVSDLSADANPYSGFQIYTNYSGATGWWIFGGTSLSTPLMAALYAMQGGYGGFTLAGAHAWAPTTPYFDVTSGSNGRCIPSTLCTAGTGWDGPTGRGSILVAATSTAPGITSASSTTFTEGTAGSFTVTASGTPTPTLAVSGTLPSGVTFTDNGNGTATLAGTPASGTAATYPLTITASNGVAPDASQSFTLTVNPASQGSFSLSASPASMSIVRGQTTSYSIRITRASGFTGAVSLSLSGLPAYGATGTFVPVITAGTSSTLYITTMRTTSPGTYALTITGQSAAQSSMVSVILTVAIR
jgi:subtilase family serine protease